ncbi:NUDIX hydrolase [Soehngenia longivitae]|uniref:NUDIX hydrolase n=1 Tax=Soehngenia longivitae TaxID=2562294 RepID=A0A4Z0D687_9FIRM|nr:NUDIX hydrolase [Soehngenia longivitae]TFZ40402.1 NUDIX hydrolase [Soehngenia longivitae]
MNEVSSGGIVFFGNSILLLKKYNGDWVLPKGRIEHGETKEEAALREVYEEAGVKGEIVSYIGQAQYEFRNLRHNEQVYKTVHWFLMKANNTHCQPQREEGFISASFVHIDKAVKIVKYEDELKIIKKSIEYMNNMR